MKHLSAFFSLLIAITMVITSTTTATAFSGQDLSKPLTSEVEQLKADIALIEAVNPNDLKEFYNKNKEWIKDLNIRLEEYIADIPENQRDIILKELRGDGEYSIRSISDYFNSHTFHLRNGYWTYSMTPKTSTRLLWSYAAAGWVELGRYYAGIRNDDGSLYNQYMCHFDLVVDPNWDIEVGRPLVSYSATLLALCNP